MAIIDFAIRKNPEALNCFRMTGIVTSIRNP